MSLWHQTSGREGIPLVLIHGWGMNAAVWQPLLEKLQPHYQVTCIDLPGHGQSPLSPDHVSLQDWATAVLESVPDRAIWLGWSLGGLIALQAALINPQKIRGLLMMTVTPCFAQRDDWQAAMPQKTLQQFAANLQADPQGTLMRFLALQVNGCDHSRELLKQLKQSFAAKPAASNAALQAGLGFLQQADLRTGLKSLQVPLEWILGAKDTLVPGRLQQALHQLDRRIVVTLLESAGHVPFFSHSDECLQVLRRLAENTQSAQT